MWAKTHWNQPSAWKVICLFANWMAFWRAIVWSNYFLFSFHIFKYSSKLWHKNDLYLCAWIRDILPILFQIILPNETSFNGTELQNQRLIWMGMSSYLLFVGRFLNCPHLLVRSRELTCSTFNTRFMLACWNDSKIFFNPTKEVICNFMLPSKAPS